MDRAIRRAVLQRDRFTCKACGKRTRGQIHHILPRGSGGSDALVNLMTLCGRCHMLASPIPNLILCEVLRIRPDDLPTEKAKVEVAIQRYEFTKRQEPPTGAGPDMDMTQVVTILESLAEGVDPLTGQVFPEGSAYQQPAVIRALYTAARELRQVQAGGPPPGRVLANAGKPWGAAEEEQLRREFGEQLDIPEIARRHGRTRVAILGRLMRLGLLRADMELPAKG